MHVKLPASYTKHWFQSWLHYCWSLKYASERGGERPRCLVPAPCVGKLCGAPGFQVQPDPTSAIVVILGVNQWMEEMCECVCLTLSDIS